MSSLTKAFAALIVSLAVAGLPAVVFAGDVPGAGAPNTKVMPPLGPGEYGTDEDNEDNALSGNPDFDMDVYLFNTDSITPIEFNINIPVDPAGSGGTLRMDVYDVDTPDEVDEVYVNGVHVGTLNGTSDTWGVNIFTIPPGVLVLGNNLVHIDVDVNNVGNWAVEIDWGIISDVTSTPGGVTINRGWIAPVKANPGDFVNLFAEVSGSPSVVTAFYGANWIADLSDPDGDGTWSGTWQVPATYLPGKWYWAVRMVAASATGEIAKWPGLLVE